MPDRPPASRAVRALITGAVQGVGFRDTTRRRALELGVMGWVRNTDEGSVAVHAEGQAAAVDTLLDFLSRGPRGAAVEAVALQETRVEGHEQFAIRGVSAGLFLVRMHKVPTPHFELGLEVAGAMHIWRLPKQPSLDPSVRRLAIEMPAREDPAGDAPVRDGPALEKSADDVVVWDRGPYEQGGRVPWPEALERGHAVFVLHGKSLRGGFALQRTRPGRDGTGTQWLLVKRRDEHARPDS